MGNPTYDQMNNTFELESGLRNLILTFAGNNCRRCGVNFAPLRKNDELCDNCRYKVNYLEYCRFCESVIFAGPDDHCCNKCFEKHKRICSRCGDEHILYQNGKCKSCQLFP